jgi:hypothetical protein
MSNWIMTIVQPILNQVEIVKNTAIIDPYPMGSLNPCSIKPIFLEGRMAKVEAL